MLAFPGMIAETAKQSGIKVPSEPDGNWNPTDYPHFHVLCNIQLGRPMDMNMGQDEVKHNADLIAGYTDQHIYNVTLEQLIADGLIYQQ